MKDLKFLQARRVYVTKIHVADNNLSELDFDLHEKFNFDYDRYENFIEIEQGTGSASAEPLEISRLIKILNDLKRKGCTHVQIEDHCDHNGYDISGYAIRMSTIDEIDTYERTASLEREKREKIQELQQEISKLQKG